MILSFILFLLSFTDPLTKVKTPEVIHVPEVTYPARAQRWGLEGKVLIEFTISTEGKPEKIKIISADNSLFIPPADSIARGMRFEPLQKPVKYNLPVIFKLKK